MSYRLSGFGGKRLVNTPLPLCTTAKAMAHAVKRGVFYLCAFNNSLYLLWYSASVLLSNSLVSTRS